MFARVVCFKQLVEVNRLRVVFVFNILEYDGTFVVANNGNTKPKKKLPCVTKQQADFTY